jgi:hypothetical protein
VIDFMVAIYHPYFWQEPDHHVVEYTGECGWLGLDAW